MSDLETKLQILQEQLKLNNEKLEHMRDEIKLSKNFIYFDLALLGLILLSVILFVI
jgi:hypothetical protein